MNKLKFNLNDRQAIREALIKYCFNVYGYEQALNSIQAVANRNKNTKQLADKTIKELNRLHNLQGV